MSGIGLIDAYGRIHDYLRISVTDRCNLRCIYCMPSCGMEFVHESKLMSFDEIEAAVAVMARMGIRKLRLTGGEPLMRQGLESLVSRLSVIQGIEDIALTTNGVFLAKKAEGLRAAGINRINISLDSLREERFREITRGGDLQKVTEGILESLKVGFDPVKINIVLMKGYNEDEIMDFLRMTLRYKVMVRFIEYMPMGGNPDAWRKRFVPLTNVLKQCEAQGWSLVQETGVQGNGPAEYYQILGAAGKFGLIHPVSEHFCDTCNRLRLTADGYLKTCLYGSEEQHIRKYAGNPQGLEDMIRRSLGHKPKNHEMASAYEEKQPNQKFTGRTMSQIGG